MTPIKFTSICPRKLRCRPLSNIQSDCGKTFVCTGEHGKGGIDPLRHCFKSEETDTMHDVNEYDLLSVAATINNALLVKELEK